MGIDVQIEPHTRSEGVVSDARGDFAKALTSTPLQQTTCLRFIDPYGDTLFNGLQLPVLLDELEALASSSMDEQIRLHLHKLIDLVRDAIEMGPHHSVRCVGD
jgi:hypothetical protein